jgi:hypothetical protein
MGMNLLIYIEKILDKLQSILHTLAGWVVAIKAWKEGKFLLNANLTEYTN